MTESNTSIKFIQDLQHLHKVRINHLSQTRVHK